MTADVKSLEAQFFGSLNQVVEPLLKAGLGFPCFSAVGAIVLETTGRKSGRKRNVPVMGMRVGNLLLVSTVRSRSQWVKNLAAHPDVTYWLGGIAYKAKAYIFSPHVEKQAIPIPNHVELIAAAILPQSKLFGISFAVLAPRPE